MRNPLQEQLLKAGLVKKQKVDAAVRAQNRQRDGKAPPPPAAEQVNAQKLLAERAERDRALAAQRNAEARARELQAQVKQIIDSHKVAHDGELAYRFVDEDKIRDILVNEAVRAQLAKGVLVIVPCDGSYALLPRSAADMVRERGGRIVVDHAAARTDAAATAPMSADDEYYQQFKVPDDLVW
jgi:uncharacterized protein